MSIPQPADFADVTFIKSSYSAEGQCVEVGTLTHQGARFYAIGDTKARHHGMLIFTEAGFAALRRTLHANQA
ncbi:DUF397 domain-containing protein [Actinosynnema sp. NPDC059335]|uniref:DUF397 domain-containing protein n=1 Tax=Actinosynnema sp. NPDC059335 TaxID=3346804 RepID=UPI00366CBDEB